MEGGKKKFEMPKLPDPGPAGQSRKFTVDISCRPDFTSEAAGQSRAGEESTGTRPPSLTISTAPSEPNFAREGLSAAPQHLGSSTEIAATCYLHRQMWSRHCKVRV